jgi:HEAT repeat protein
MLKDAQPSRRAVSACILGRRGNAEQKQAVRDLLKDTDALVRLRAAQGLLAGRDACGVATLIELLTDPSIEIAWQAEELLRWVSNETAPDAVVGSGEPEASAKAQQAWKTWAKDHAAKIDFAALEQEPRRPLLLLGYERTKGKLWIFGSDGMTRCEWKLKGGLADAQYVPGGTVLTLHEQPVREKPMLAERDRGGTVLWQYDNLADPKYVQRLSNGHFFVAEFVDVAAPYLTYKVFAAGARLVETQPKKHSTFGHALYRRANGKLVVAMFGLYRPEPSSFTGVQEYDPATDHNRDFVGTGGRFGAKVYVESAPEGGILASGFQHIPNRKDRMAEVVEFDRDGDKIWKYQVPEGTHAFRLAGGNTLICADNRVVEASADRRMVGEIPMELSPSVARPCLGLVRFGFDAFPTNIDLEIDVDYRVRCLGKKNPRTRINALRRLADFRHLAARVIPKLKAHVLDPDAGVQDEMKKTLVAIGVDEIPRLIQEIKIDDPERRYLAVGRIGGFRNGPGVLETLLDALKDENAKVRWMAVRSLGNRDSDPQSRRFYSDLPGSYRQSAEKIVPHLIRAFQDSDERVQQSAFATLGVLGPDAAAAVPKLIELLRSEKSMSVRANAAVTLGRVGHASNDARAALLTAVKETKDPTLLEWSIQGLCALRPVPNEAAKLLIQHYLASDNSSRVIRETCLFNILQIGGNDKATRDFFWQVLKDETTGLAKRCEIATRLVEIESDTTDLMDFMTNLAARQAELSDRRHVTESIRWQKKTLRQRQQHSMR